MPATENVAGSPAAAKSAPVPAAAPAAAAAGAAADKKSDKKVDDKKKAADDKKAAAAAAAKKDAAAKEKKSKTHGKKVRHEFRLFFPLDANPQAHAFDIFHPQVMKDLHIAKQQPAAQAAAAAAKKEADDATGEDSRNDLYVLLGDNSMGLKLRDYKYKATYLERVAAHNARVAALAKAKADKVAAEAAKVAAEAAKVAAEAAKASAPEAAPVKVEDEEEDDDPTAGSEAVDTDAAEAVAGSAGAAAGKSAPVPVAAAEAKDAKPKSAEERAPKPGKNIIGAVKPRRLAVELKLRMGVSTKKGGEQWVKSICQKKAAQQALVPVDPNSLAGSEQKLLEAVRGAIAAEIAAVQLTTANNPHATTQTTQLAAALTRLPQPGAFQWARVTKNRVPFYFADAKLGISAAEQTDVVVTTEASGSLLTSHTEKYRSIAVETLTEPENALKVFAAIKEQLNARVARGSAAAGAKEPPHHKYFVCGYPELLNSFYTTPAVKA